MASNSVGFQLSFYGAPEHEGMSQGLALAEVLREQTPEDNLCIELNRRREILRGRVISHWNPDATYTIQPEDFGLVLNILSVYLRPDQLKKRQSQAFDDIWSEENQELIKITADELSIELSRVSIEQIVLSGVYHEMCAQQQGNLD